MAWNEQLLYGLVMGDISLNRKMDQEPSLEEGTKITGEYFPKSISLRRYPSKEITETFQWRER